MNLKKSLGITDSANKDSREDIIKYINLKLSALGCPIYEKDGGDNLGVAEDLIRNYRERSRLFTSAYTPSGERIQSYLNSYFSHLPDEEWRPQRVQPTGVALASKSSADRVRPKRLASSCQ